MKPTVTSGFIGMSMERPVLEIDDFEQFVDQNRALVLRFVFASVRDMDLAETLTQDCFWNAYKSRATFRGDCGIQTWLIRIALNLIRDHARNRRFQSWRKAERVGGEEMQHWPDRSISPEEKAVVSEQ